MFAHREFGKWYQIRIVFNFKKSFLFNFIRGNMNEYIKVNLTGKLLRVAVSAINFSFNSISHTNTSLFPERYSYVIAKRFWFLIVSFFVFYQTCCTGSRHVAGRKVASTHWPVVSMKVLCLNHTWVVLHPHRQLNQMIEFHGALYSRFPHSFIRAWSSYYKLLKLLNTAPELQHPMEVSQIGM